MNMEQELYNSRSFSACIKAAYTLMLTNLKTILRRTWLPVLCYALVATLLTFINVPDKGIHDIGMSHPFLTLTLMAVSIVLFLVTTIWTISTVCGLLNDSTRKQNIRRSTLVVLMEALFLAIMGGLVMLSQQMLVTQSPQFPEAETASPSWTAVLPLAGIVILMVFLLPFFYSAMKYLMEKDSPLRAMFGHDYLTGFKHWGFLFLAGFISLIIVSIIMVITLIPFDVLLMAQITNQLGMLDGDPNGAPDYFLALFIVITVISMFLVIYESLWIFLVNYYVYGSIRTQEKERKQLNQLKKQDESTESIVH